MKKKNKRKSAKVRSVHKSYGWAREIGLDDADMLMAQYKSQLSSIAVEAIKNSKLQVNEIVAKSGVSRSKVSAIKNGCLAGISCDLFLRVISVTGTELKLKVA